MPAPRQARGANGLQSGDHSIEPAPRVDAFEGRHGADGLAGQVDPCGALDGTVAG